MVESRVTAITSLEAITYLNNTLQLFERQIETELSTCGYVNGDPDRMRTADPGYNCRIDTRNGIWGFCPTTIAVATDCGLAGSCVDSGSCTDGCGFTDRTELTTFTCEDNARCSTALLTFGVDQTYAYIACGARATTDHYLANPTPNEVTTMSTTSSESTSTEATSEETTTTQVQSRLSPSEFTSTQASSAAGEPLSKDNSNTDDRVGSSDNSTNLGAIIGGVLGGIAIICVTVIGVFWLRRRNNKKPRQSFPPGTNEEPKPPNYSYRATAQTQLLPVDTQYYPSELPTQVHRFELS